MVYNFLPYETSADFADEPEANSMTPTSRHYAVRGHTYVPYLLRSEL